MPDPLILILCGDRDWTDPGIIRSSIVAAVEWRDRITIVFEGGCRGADTLGKVVAEDMGFEVRTFQADWNKHGRAAGPIRNRKMARTAKTIGGKVECLGFHDDIERSKGTKDMRAACAEFGIEFTNVTH